MGWNIYSVFGFPIIIRLEELDCNGVFRTWLYEQMVQPLLAREGRKTMSFYRLKKNREGNNMRITQPMSV